MNVRKEAIRICRRRATVTGKILHRRMPLAETITISLTTNIATVITVVAS